VAAIHVVALSRWSFLMMMPGNRAMVSGAAVHAMRVPYRRSNWGIQQSDRQQTKAGGNHAGQWMANHG